MMDEGRGYGRLRGKAASAGFIDLRWITIEGAQYHPS